MAKNQRSAPSRKGRGADVTDEVVEVYPLKIRLTNNTPIDLIFPDARFHIRSNVGPHENFIDAVFLDEDMRRRFEADVEQIEILNGFKDTILWGDIATGGAATTTEAVTLSLQAAVDPNAPPSTPANPDAPADAPKEPAQEPAAPAKQEG